MHQVAHIPLVPIVCRRDRYLQPKQCIRQHFDLVHWLHRRMQLWERVQSGHSRRGHLVCWWCRGIWRHSFFLDRHQRPASFGFHWPKHRWHLFRPCQARSSHLYPNLICKICSPTVPDQWGFQSLLWPQHLRQHRSIACHRLGRWPSGIVSLWSSRPL